MGIDFEVSEDILSIFHALFLKHPRENIGNDQTKKLLTDLRDRATKMTMTTSCYSDVIGIVSTDHSVQYFINCMDYVTSCLDSEIMINFKCLKITNFIALQMVIWNVTDKSPNLCSRLVLSNAHKTLWKFIDHSKLRSSLTFKNANLLVNCTLGILHNIVQLVPRTRSDYREYGAVNILLPYLSTDCTSSGEICIKSLQTAALFILANIVNENEHISVIKADCGVLEYILKVLKHALRSAPDYYSTNYGYHAVEVFACLNCLSGNDENKRNLLSNNAFQYITDALKVSLKAKNQGNGTRTTNSSCKEYQFSAVDLARGAIDLLLNLSFLEEAREQLKETSDLYKLCQQCKGPEWGSECRKSVHALTLNLSQSRNWVNESGELDASSITASPKPQGHIMISYNNTCQDLVVKLKEALTNRGWNVWIYTDHCKHGSFLVTMSQAVADSAAMILCLCSPYNASIHCVKEAISAYDFRLPLLPIRMESGYIPLDVLRFLLSGTSLLDLLDDEQVEHVADSLNVQLKRFGVMQCSPKKTNPSSAPPPKLVDSRKKGFFNSPRQVRLASAPVKGHQRSSSDGDCLPIRNSMSPEGASPALALNGDPMTLRPLVAFASRLGAPWQTSQLRHSPLYPRRFSVFADSPRTCLSCTCVNGHILDHRNPTNHRGGSSHSSCTPLPYIGSPLANYPPPLEAYLTSQIPSEAVKDWHDWEVHKWLADNQLSECTQQLSWISGPQLYELAWLRIRSCDTFFRNLTNGSMDMSLCDQLKLSAALSKLPLLDAPKEAGRRKISDLRVSSASKPPIPPT